jgi:ABC-type branched-subunit amino acid transport system permease subunit
MAPRITPDRGHPVAQQVVLGACVVVSVAALLLTSFTAAYQVTLPDWVWKLILEAIVCAFVAYARVWVWPPRRQ